MEAYDSFQRCAGVEAWRAAGVSTPILVPASTSGGQARAVQEVFDAFA